MFQAGNHLMGFWAGGSLLTNYPAYDSAGTASGVTATPVAPTYPATLVAGDFLLLVVFIGHSTSTPSVTTPAGWSVITSGAQNAGAFRQGLFAFSKTSDGTETGTLNVTVSMAGASNVALARIYRFTTTSALEGAGVSNATGAWASTLADPCLGNYGNWEGVSVVVGGTKRLLVQVVGMNNDWSSGFAVPSGFGASVSSATTAGADAAIGITTKQSDANFTATSYEIISAAGSSSNDQGDGFTIGFALVGT